MGDIGQRIEIVMGMCREKIPLRFYRTFEDRMFDTCAYCHQPLLAEDNWYVIMKYYSKNELREEIAICRNCISELKESYSDESKRALKAVYSDDYLRKRLSILFEVNPGEDRTALMTSRCAICDKDKQLVSEYFEYAHCLGEEILFYSGPSMVCDKCTLKIYESLSSQTKDYKHRFFQKHFGYPPPGLTLDDPVERELGIWNLG